MLNRRESYDASIGRTERSVPIVVMRTTSKAERRPIAVQSGEVNEVDLRLPQRAWSTTRPPISTSTYRLWLSSMDIPIRGAVSAP